MRKNFSTLAELFNEMYKLGIENMEGFHKDIITDTEAITLHAKSEGEHFIAYWMVRKNGTHLRPTAYQAAEVAVDWGKQYLFTAKIQREEDGYSLEIIDKAA